MKKITVFVCTHKPVPNIPSDDVYTPILLHRVNSPYREEMKNVIGDDTGDNISSKGIHYSEGTAMYWIWKNYHESEYVGISQYRRQFVEKFTEDNIDSFFEDGTDVILPNDYFRSRTRLFTVLTYLQMEDFLILKGAIKKICPEYMDTFNSFLNDYIDHPFNMMVCRKELYDKYAEWAFSICFEMEKYVKYSSYSNGSRLLGYVLELLTPVYFLHNKCRIKKMAVNFDGHVIKMGRRDKLKMSLFHNIIWRHRKSGVYYPLDPSIIRGMKADGIDIEP